MEETDPFAEEAEELSRGSLGSRIRSLRRSAGMSQAELAGDRFSKEYVSQIERGKTVPSTQTLEWLAVRLATEREFLEHGFHRGDLEAAREQLAAAEALAEKYRYKEALELYRDASPAVHRVGLPELTLRLVNGEAWAQLRKGDIDTALSLLEGAQKLAAVPECTDLDRAEVIFRVGVCRYSRSEIPEATDLFTQALALADQSASDRLRVDILGWRSRCYRRERDWVAAWDDIERALELANAASNLRQLAEINIQASLVTHRQGRWLLARTYAERSKSAYEELDDRASATRVLINIAGLDHLLGDPAGAIARLQEAFSVFVEVGQAVDAGYVLSSQADIHLGLNEFEKAETQARKALELLGDRVDHLQEIGTAQLALGRALAGQNKTDDAETMVAAAEQTFKQARSISHQADALIARGDLETSRGDDRAAAAHFKQAVEALRQTDIDNGSDIFSIHPS